MAFAGPHINISWSCNLPYYCFSKKSYKYFVWHNYQLPKLHGMILAYSVHNCLPNLLPPSPEFKESVLTPEQIANNLRDEMKRLKKRREFRGQVRCGALKKLLLWKDWSPTMCPIFVLIWYPLTLDTGSSLAWFGALLTRADVGGAHDGRAGGPEQLAIFVHHLRQAGQAHLHPQADEHDRWGNVLLILSLHVVVYNNIPKLICVEFCFNFTFQLSECVPSVLSKCGQSMIRFSSRSFQSRFHCDCWSAFDIHDHTWSRAEKKKYMITLFTLYWPSPSVTLMSPQYDAFVKFIDHQIQKRFNESMAPSYLS